MNLTPAQLKAVNSNANSIVVRAVAGAGKTTTIVNRVARLLLDTDPDKILILTFTNKMAGSLMAKLPDLKWVGTFHGIGLRLISKYINNNIVVMSDATDRAIIKEVKKNSLVKMTDKKIKECFASTRKGIEVKDKAFNRLLNQYNIYLTTNNLISYDQIEEKWLGMLKDPTIKKSIGDRFEHIIVDEFQDTSEMELKILNAMDIRNKMVVGDVFQNIYGFRGTTTDNIINYEGEIIETNESFRIPQKQVPMINNIIKKNTIKYHMEMRSSVAGSEPIIIKTTDTDVEKKVRELMGKFLMLYRPKDIMVLCRTNREVERAGEMLAGFPVEILSSKTGWNSVMGGIIYTFLKFMNNPNDFNTERLIKGMKLEKETIIDKWGIASKYDGTPLTTVIMESEYPSSRIFEQVVLIANSKDKIETKVNKYYEMMDRNYIFPYWEKRLIEETSFDHCLVSIKKLVALCGEEVGKIIDAIESLNTQDMLSPNDTIKIMTAHTSKGLESPVVFLMFVKDGSFPIDKDGDDQGELRLFYVAATRNKNSLVIIQTGDSRFMEDGDERLYKYI